MTESRTCGAPTVSVVMPAYNAEPYIGQAIESVRSQTFGDWELIVVDDCSTDGTAGIARAAAAADPRVRVVRQPANGGVAAARNRGVAEARGAWVALLDSDDVWEPEKLELQTALARDSGAPIVYCSYDLMGRGGEDLGRPFTVPTQTDFHAMLAESVIGCSTCLIDADLMKSHPFLSDVQHEDYLLWMTLLREGNAARGCPEVLMHYRQIPGSRSNDKLRAARGRWDIYRRGLGLSWPKSAASLLRYTISGLRKYYL